MYGNEEDFTITVMRDVRCLACGQGRFLLGLSVTWPSVVCCYSRIHHSVDRL